MFPHNAVAVVTAFPPAALPAFTGTMRSSDSLQDILPSSLYYHLSGILSFLKDPAGYPGLPPIPNVQHAMLSDPEEAEEHLPFALPCVDFRHVQLRRPSHFSTYEAQSL